MVYKHFPLVLNEALKSIKNFVNAFEFNVKCVFLGKFLKIKFRPYNRFYLKRDKFAKNNRTLLDIKR